MNYYLAKTEPNTFSLDDLEREHRTVWDGVTNPQAVKAIQNMKTGDRVFIYHSGGVSGVVGIATIVGDGRADSKNPKSAVADFQFLARLDPPTTLAEVKQSGLFADFALVRQSRLSTMAVPREFVDWLRRRYPGVKI